MPDNKPSKEHREAVEKVWEEAEHKGKALARWAKRGKGYKGREQRWATVQWFLHVHQMSTEIDEQHHAQDLARRAKLYRMFRWARAKARKIRRRHRPRPDGQHHENCGVATDAWGGSQACGECAVLDVADDYGVYISSRKRSVTDPLTIANPDSDHSEENTTAYAWDIATFAGAAIAAALARALGIAGYYSGNYNPWSIARAWGRFRVQILWAVAGHFNHVHLGMRRS